ncbi:MAG: PorV/PorQ family protein [bacterium]
MRKYIFILFVPILFCAAAVSAADDVFKQVGTTGAQFLKITVGARPAAMGDSNAALADDANAPLINPAGAGFLFSPEIQAMHGLWLGDMSYDYAGYIHPTRYGTFGGSLQYLGGPDLNKIVNGVAAGKFKAYDAAANVSYALQIHEMLAVGINTKGIQSKIADESAATAAADIGVKFRTSNELFSAGIVGQHLGGTLKFIDKADPLPSIMRVGIGFKLDLPQHHSLFNFTAQANMPRDNKPFYGLGVEHWGGDMFALRFGYTIDSAENELDPLTNWRAGLGFKIKYFLIDYAYQPFDSLGDTHRLSMGWRFSQLGSRKTKVTATLRADPEIFSPNDDGIKDSTFLIPTIPPEIAEIKKWNIDIRDNIGALVKSIIGEDVLPSILSWDGKNTYNAFVENGEYTYQLNIQGENRIEASSSENILYVDISPPTVSLAVSSASFTPNGDGIDDTAEFRLDASDIHGIARWQLNITNQQGKFIHVIKSSEALPTEVTWNGKDDYYNTVVGDGYYDIQFFVWDNAGNRNSSPINSIDLQAQKEFKNIEVKEDSKGLTVNLTSNLLFGSGKSVLQPESKTALNELIELLKTYPENEVAIEGHSDSLGSDENNMRLSSARAWSVYSYLVKNGINSKRLKPKGYGETRPVDSNKTKVGRAKNRRVVVIILKTEKTKTQENKE